MSAVQDAHTTGGVSWERPCMAGACHELPCAAGAPSSGCTQLEGCSGLVEAPLYHLLCWRSDDGPQFHSMPSQHHFCFWYALVFRFLTSNVSKCLRAVHQEVRQSTEQFY